MVDLETPVEQAARLEAELATAFEQPGLLVQDQRPRPAKRALVPIPTATRIIDQTRLEWLRSRQRGLGATDIASLAGEGFLTPRQVYASKVDQILEEEEVHPLLLMGLATEDLNASLYVKRMGGIDIMKPAGFVRHPIIRYSGCTPDRIIDTGCPLELKYTPFFGDRWGEEMTEEIPLGYIVQTQWQMVVLEADSADVSALNGTGDHRLYRIGADARLMVMLEEIAEEFWMEFVEKRTPPPVDWMPRQIEDVQARCEKLALGKTLTMGVEAEALAAEYLQLKSVVNEAKVEIDARKEKLKALMGDAQKGFAGPYRLNRVLVDGGKEVRYLTSPQVQFRVTEPKLKGSKTP